MTTESAARAEARDDRKQMPRGRALVLLIYTFVFITGAAALVFEVTWQKYLSRLVGSDTMATAIIIGTFLGGLSLGYFLMGKLSSKVKNQLQVYAVLEAVIGIWCFMFPWLFDAFYAATATWSFEPPAAIVLQGVFSSFVLFGPPTVCMGATVPLLTRGISANVSVATAIHAKIYGINTAGASAGTLLAGFVLLPRLGLPLTLKATALFNLATAIFFFMLSRYSGVRGVASRIAQMRLAKFEDAPCTDSLGVSRKILFVIAFLSGLYVMTFENVLIRIVNLSLGSSSYSFALIVAVFLLGIASGSYIVGHLGKVTHKILFYNQLALTCGLLLIFATLDIWPWGAHLVRIGFQGNTLGFMLYYALAFCGLTLVLFVPLALCGATIPIAFDLAKRDLDRVGDDSGLLLSFNTLGNLIGSILGGVLVYYLLNMDRVFLLAVVLAGCTTLIAALGLGGRLKILASALLLLTVACFVTSPFFDTERFSFGVFRYRTPLAHSFQGPEKFFAEISNTYRTLLRQDGPSASVSVLETSTKHPDYPTSRAIIVNGKSDSDTFYDIYTTRLSAHLPSLLAGQRNRAMVVGIGTGITVGELTKYPFEMISVAETSPGVVDALPFFAKDTGDVGRNPRVEIKLGDAFRVLGRSALEWDVIICEPSNPWVMGVDSLYTEEFYELVWDRLESNGAFLQWMHVYSANTQMVGMVTRTLTNRFPWVYTFRGARGDLLFVAKKQEITQLDLQRAKQVLEDNPKVSKSLAELHLVDLETLLLRQVFTPEHLKKMFFESDVQTLDLPRLHYMAGRAFFTGEGLKEGHLYPASSFAYAGEYLLDELNPSWRRGPWTKNSYRKYLDALHVSLEGQKMPAGTGIDLLAYFEQPEQFPYAIQSSNFASLQLIALMSQPHITEKHFESVGLKSHSLRERAEKLVAELYRSRSWLMPYPIVGLVQYLQAGANAAADKHEQNWFLLQQIRIAILEHASNEHIDSLLGRLHKRADGRPLLRTPDQKLWLLVQKLKQTF